MDEQLSRRWMPTPQQLQVLKDLYYIQGLRNPSTEEIRRISQRLSQLGRIEEKNVFYWFQNRKSRERRLAITTAIAATPLQVAAGGGGGAGAAAKQSKLETLPLFPMHSDGADSSHLSLELTLRPYSAAP